MNKLKMALTLGILLILVTDSAGHAGSPPLPASFYGTMQMDGAGVPAGTLVSAWINGVEYAETTTTPSAPPTSRPRGCALISAPCRTPCLSPPASATAGTCK